MLRRRRHFAQEELLRTTHIPAPTAGMNLVDPASALGPNQAISTVNLVKGERGLLPRPGYEEQATHVGATDGDVRSLLAFHGTTGAQNRFFGCAPDGIYDVSTPTSTPTLKHAFGISDTNSGRGVGCDVAIAGGHFYLYADEANGYLVYDESTDTWAAGSTTVIVPADIRFVTFYKNRVWFVQTNSLIAGYLAAGTLAGAVTTFDLGTVFQHGGQLIGMWSWSLDAGDGRNSNLVFITSTGEVAIYTGDDPGAAGWKLAGLWNVGGVPVGRRLAYAYGSDLLMLTTQGALPISKLVNAETPLGESLYATRQMQPYFVQAMAEQGSRIGWEMNLHPKAGFLIINTPGVPGSVQEQLAMPYSSKGWSRLQGLDILCMEVWDGNLYFGTRNGRVCKSAGYVDDARLGGDMAHIQSVNCFTIGGFSTMGSARYKNVTFVVPRFITHGVSPIQEALARYDFDIADAGTASGTALGTGSLWDSAIWDTSLWMGLTATSEIVQGTVGRGVNVAVGVAFQSQDYTLLAGFDVMWQEEGIF